MQTGTRTMRLMGSMVAGVAALALMAVAPLAGPDHAEHSDKASPYKVGEQVADFKLTDTAGVERSLQEYLDDDKIVVLEWFNPDCPFIKKHHVRFNTMVDLEQEFRDQGVVWLAINSGAPGKQGVGLDRNIKARADYEMQYPILLDESGMIGRRFGAKTTPDMRIITPDGVLAYSGAIDSNPMPRGKAKTNFVRRALREIIAGETVTKSKTRPYGCAVKYGSRSKGG